MIRILWISLVLVLSVISLQAQSNSSEKARSLVQKFVDDQNIPGLAATVYHKGEIIWSEGYGYANLEHQVKVDPAKTKFRIGSVSKTFTASALGRLMDTKDVDLDAPIQDYVPSFPKKKYSISLRQLGGHTAGIRHYKGGEFTSSKHYPTVIEGLDIFKESPLLFEPSTKYQYSSYGWNLLSAGIESIAGSPFLDYISREVFEELDMKSTLAEFNDRIIPHRTAYYISGREDILNAPYVDNSYKWAGGGFLSTTHDLVLFGKAHMNANYISQPSLDALMKPQSLTDGQSTNYGIGWRTYTDNQGIQWVGHSGGSVGGTTIFIMNKEEDMIIAITGNRSSIRYGSLHFDLAHLFLK